MQKSWRRAWAVVGVAVMSLAAGAGAADDRYGDELPAGATVRYGTQRLAHVRHAWAAAISRDNKRVASVDGLGRVLVWEATTGKRLWKLEGKLPMPTELKFSPDGKWLVVAAKAGLQFYKADTGEKGTLIVTGDLLGPALAFTSDGTGLLTASQKVRVWDVSTGQERAKLEPLKAGAIRAVAISPDGTLAALGGTDGKVRLWDMKAQTPERELALPGGDVSAVTFGGPWIAAGNRGWSVPTYNEAKTAIIKSTWHEPVTMVWDVRTGEVVKQIDGVGFPQFAGAQTLWTSKLIEMGPSWRLAKVDTGTWEVKETEIVCGHRWALADDGSLLAALMASGGMELRELPTGRAAVALDGPRTMIGWVGISPDDQTVVTGHGARSVPWPDAHGGHVWTAQGALVSQLDAGATTLISGAFSGDGKSFVGSCPDGTVRMWETAGWTPTSKVKVVEMKRAAPKAGDPPKPWPQPVASVAWMADGKRVVASTMDGKVFQCDPAAGTNVALDLEWKKAPTENTPARVAVSSKAVAVVGMKASGLFDADTGAMLAPLHVAPKGFILAVCFSPDGKQLAILSPSGDAVSVLDATTGQETAAITLPPGHVQYSLALSHDGKLLVTCERETGTVRLWRIADGKELTSFTGHEGDGAWVTFTRDDSAVISGSADCTALRWDITRWAR